MTTTPAPERPERIELPNGCYLQRIKESTGYSSGFYQLTLPDGHVVTGMTGEDADAFAAAMAQPVAAPVRSAEVHPWSNVWPEVKQRLVESLPDISDMPEPEWFDGLDQHQQDIHVTLREAEGWKEEAEALRVALEQQSETSGLREDIRAKAIAECCAAVRPAWGEAAVAKIKRATGALHPEESVG